MRQHRRLLNSRLRSLQSKVEMSTPSPKKPVVRGFNTEYDPMGPKKNQRKTRSRLPPSKNDKREFEKIIPFLEARKKGIFYHRNYPTLQNPNPEIPAAPLQPYNWKKVNISHIISGQKQGGGIFDWASSLFGKKEDEEEILNVVPAVPAPTMGGKRKTRRRRHSKRKTAHRRR
jgi:hypothetical protein